MKNLRIVKVLGRPSYLKTTGYYRLKFRARSCNTGNYVEVTGMTDLNPDMFETDTLVCIPRWEINASNVKVKNGKIGLVELESSYVNKTLPSGKNPETFFTEMTEIYPYMQLSAIPYKAIKFMNPRGIRLTQFLESLDLFWGHETAVRIMEYETTVEINDKVKFVPWYTDVTCLTRDPFELLNIYGLGISHVKELIHALPADQVTPQLRQELEHFTNILDKQNENGSVYVIPDKRVDSSLFRYKPNGLVCLSRDWNRERAFVQTVCAPQDVEWIDSEISPDLNALQRQAAKNIMAHSCSLITGPPGTGKTRIIRSLVRSILDAGYELVMLAPTGKAVFRIKDTLRSIQQDGLHYYTIHKANFVKFSDIKKELIWVVDESSMLDIEHVQILTRMYLKYHAQISRFVFMGDIDQLPPVGVGDMFRDLILSRRFPTVTLEQRYRQNESGLMRAITDVENRRVPVTSADGTFQHINTHDTETYFRDLLSDLRYDDFKQGRVLVLSGMNCTVHEFGKMIRNHYFPETAEYTAPDFVHMDLVMCNTNLYRDNTVLLRGTPGWVDGDSVVFADGQIEDLCEMRKHVAGSNGSKKPRMIHNYATTVHKSQGSEADTVIFVLDARDCAKIHKRNLLYTAITRAKKRCIVIGLEDNLIKMIRREPEKRHTTVNEHFGEV
jgi:hypothetical protein